MREFPVLITEPDTDLIGPAIRRDPMGMFAIWSVRGRDLVPHLTATTNKVRGFQVLVEVLRLWEIYQTNRSISDDLLDQFFLLVEQAFGRIIGQYDEWGLPGNLRIMARLNSGPLCISVEDRSWHLLGSQIQNGTWGVYRGTARRLGLLDEKSTRLSDETLSLASDCTQFNHAAQNQLFDLIDKAIQGDTVELPVDGRNAMVKAIYRTYRDIPLADHLYFRIVESNEFCKRLAILLLDVGDEEKDWRDFLDSASSTLPTYRATIKNVTCCENFISVFESIFYWLCASVGQSVEQATSTLPVELNKLKAAHQAFADSGYYGSGINGTRARRLREEVNTNDLVVLAHSVLNLHRKVSEERKSSPWVWKADDGKLSSDMDVERPSEGEFNTGVFWRNDYYLGSLSQIAKQLITYFNE